MKPFIEITATALITVDKVNPEHFRAYVSPTDEHLPETWADFDNQQDAIDWARNEAGA